VVDGEEVGFSMVLIQQAPGTKRTRKPKLHHNFSAVSLPSFGLGGIPLRESKATFPSPWNNKTSNEKTGDFFLAVILFASVWRICSSITDNSN
jgi:hypothetical protein